MRVSTPCPKIVCLIDTAIGTLLCSSVTLVLALVFNDTRFEMLLPLVSLGVVIVVAARFGVATGVFGSLVSALLLAYFVFSPHHSLSVASAEERSSLSWLLLGGISLSFLFTPRRDQEAKRDAESDHR